MGKGKGWTPERRAAQAERMRKVAKANWSEERRAVQAERMRQTLQHPDVAAKRAERSASAETQAKRSAASKKRWTDPEYRARHSAAQKELWTEERRAAHAAKLRERLKDPVLREKRRQAAKARWDKPGSRERFAGSVAAKWADPKWREGQLARFNEPERIEKLRAATTRFWSGKTPDERRQATVPARKSIKGGKQVTSIEARACEVLTELDEAYQLRKVIDGYVVDIFVPSRNLIVECDGKFWHDSPERQEFDAARDDALREQGYTIVRIPHDADLDTIRTLLS